MLNIRKQKKGFTLIELIVVMAVLAMLVLLAAPKFLGQTKEATFTKHISNAKVLEDASERYYIDHGKWPRGLDEEAYTPEQVTAYAEKIYDITGKELTLEEGKYWDIDYTALHDYAKLPDEDERANYILRNPVGKVYYLDGLSPVGENRNDQSYVTENTPIAVIGATAEEGSLQNGFYVDESISWSHEASRSPNGSAIVAAEWEGTQDKYGETSTVRIGLRVQNELGFWSEWVYQDVKIVNPTIRFSGLSAAAYDGDLNTYHQGVGTVTWTGDLANREIQIKALTVGTGTTLYGTFYDENNQVVYTYAGQSRTELSYSGATTTTKIVVPEGATRVAFTAFNSSYNSVTNVRIYEIVVPEILTRPTIPVVTSTSANSSITLDWGSTRRVQILKNNAILTDITGKSYTDKPLHADSEHTYRLLFLDEYGNGVFAPILTKRTSSKDIVFRGITPAAFDSDLNTYHQGVGTVTWTGDLANREIQIKALTVGTGTTLYGTFYDENNQVVYTYAGQSRTELSYSGATTTTKIVVPEGATRVAFTAFNSSYNSVTNVRIYEVTVITQ